MPKRRGTDRFPVGKPNAAAKLNRERGELETECADQLRAQNELKEKLAQVREENERLEEVARKAQSNVETKLSFFKII